MTAQRPLGFWLKLLDGLINSQFEETLGEQGVTRRQWQLLNLLARGPATSPQLAQALEPFLVSGEPGGLTDELTHLRARGWVDSRDAAFSLTDEGRRASDDLRERVGRSRRTLAEGVTADEYEQTLRVLKRMARNLGWRDPEGAE